MLHKSFSFWSVIPAVLKRESRKNKATGCPIKNFGHDENITIRSSHKVNFKTYIIFGLNAILSCICRYLYNKLFTTVRYSCLLSSACKTAPPFNCLPLSFDHSNISASVMFLLKFLDICFRLLLYESISIPGSFQIPPHPPFLKGGLPTSIPF